MSRKAGRRYRVEKKNKKTKFIVLTVVLLLLAAIAAAAYIHFMPKPEEIYAEALAYIDSKDYDLAEESMEKIKNHENIDELKTRLALAKYADAVEAGDYKKANLILSDLSDYKDYDKMNSELTFMVGKEVFDLKDYDAAETVLSKIKDNEEARALLDEITYIKAAEAKASGDFEYALALLNEIPNHKDTEAIKKEIIFETALKHIEAGDYESAFSVLDEIPDYPEAITLKEQIETEAILLELINKYKTHLPNPDTMVILDLNIYDAIEGHSVLIKAESENASGNKAVSYAVFGNWDDPEINAYFISEADFLSPDSNYHRVTAALINAYLRKTESSITFDTDRLNNIIKNGISVGY